ncbi:MAG: sensor histidine kinase [Saprospiraceae bacterium]
MNSTEMFSKELRREITQILILYCFMAIGYYIALVMVTGAYYAFKGIGLNYLIKALLTAPLWWLFFRRLEASPFWKKLLVHFIALPLFTTVWMWVYYMLSDSIGMIRAQGSQIVWDFYITVLFYIVQFGVFHLIDYYKKLKQQQLLAMQLSQLNLQSELSALKAQLNPHFLYNVFNTINAAIPVSAKNARDMVNKLSDLFRYQLKASREELVMVIEELEFVKKYLDLERERFGDRLLFEIDVDEEILNVKIPPMLLQPIVENSVKHGISPLIEGGKISLDIRNMGSSLQIVISDTGAGIDNQRKSDLLKRGIGLSNTEERLEKMYGKGMELTDNTPKGLIVKFEVPINNESESL